MYLSLVSPGQQVNFQQGGEYRERGGYYQGGYQKQQNRGNYQQRERGEGYQQRGGGYRGRQDGNYSGLYLCFLL